MNNEDDDGINRKFWFDTGKNREEILQSDLFNRSESLVVLGEAGMGKSHLLSYLSTKKGYSLCTARQLINRHNPESLLDDKTQVLVIDALDEVSSCKEGDAVNLVLQKLGELDYPRFVLSCRVADWRSATGIEAISEQYPGKSLELHLVPFNDEDAEAFLSATLGQELAKSVVDHFKIRGLNDLLGNPQTLELIATVAGSETLPDTLSELFETATEILQIEHKESKAESSPAREVGLDAVGAAFAGLILTGSDVIVRKPQFKDPENNLQISDIKLLPRGEAVESMLDTRLFKSSSSDKFHYIHRRVGEFLGARWLAKVSDTGRKRRRLLSVFNVNGLVPTSLRGIHAWLVRDPAFAQDVIAADPMGLIEYGDADSLTIEQARLLLKALEKLADENPYFHTWGKYSLCSILRPELIEELRRLITDERVPFALSLMILQAIKGTDIARLLEDDLKTIVLKKTAEFSSRSVASKILAEHGSNLDWTYILQKLYEYNDEDSIRVAIGLVDSIAYKGITADLITNLVISYVRAGAHMGGVLMPIENRLPLLKIPEVLDCFTSKVRLLGKAHQRPGDSVLTDFAYNLILRVLRNGTIAGNRLWNWLEIFEEYSGHDTKTIKKLNDFIQGGNQLRREIQQDVLLTLPGDDSLWLRENHLCKRLSAFKLSEEDTIVMLGNLDHTDTSDERWRDVIRLIEHDNEKGGKVRDAAHDFAVHSPDLLMWIDNLALSQEPAWKSQQEESNRKYKDSQAMANSEIRREYAGHIEELRQGKSLYNPAMAYLKLFSDIGDDVPAHKRVSQWLGDEIAAAVHGGFEVFLQISPPDPSAQNIISAMVENKHYRAGYIIVAALAERFRKGVDYGNLIDERLLAGFFEIKRSQIDSHAEIKGLLQSLEEAILARGIWEKANRLFYEPQLEARREFINDLCSFMHDETHSDLAADLATEWLTRYPVLSIGTENELIHKLLRVGRVDSLRHVLKECTNIENDERRRNYDAIGLVVNFKQTRQRLEQTSVEPEMIWHIRNIMGVYISSSNIPIDPLLYEWVIMKFRHQWPVERHPYGVVTRGDTNPYDATDYIQQLIRRLGNMLSKETTTILEQLRNSESDGYTETIKVVIAERARNLVERFYVPPTFEAISAITRDVSPVSAADLQIVVIEELEVVQVKISSDDVNSWRGFYDAGCVPFKEERCRDYLIGLLRQGTYEIVFDPEAHVAADKRVDIACSIRQYRMPIEIKGQWHDELWTGADEQLDKLYTGDWRAEGRGIYLVLWFGVQGNANKQLKSPGRGKVRPQTPDELKEMIISRSNAAKEGRVFVYVLDVTSPS